MTCMAEAEPTADVEFYSNDEPLSKEAIRELQMARGGAPCFQTDWRIHCRDTHCPWRRDCQRLVAEWRR